VFPWESIKTFPRLVWPTLRISTDSVTVVFGRVAALEDFGVELEHAASKRPLPATRIVASAMPRRGIRRKATELPGIPFEESSTE
jgi:hypothetical protein